MENPMPFLSRQSKPAQKKFFLLMKILAGD
jgi:hypothetical protein